MEFRDVSFKYPGSEVWALRHVSMKFKVGNRLAIVGEMVVVRQRLLNCCVVCMILKRGRFC